MNTSSRFSTAIATRLSSLLITLLAVWVAVSSVGCQSSRTLRAGEQRTLTAASNMLHPPFSSWDKSGKAIGIEVDLVEHAAAQLGCRVQWVERPFADLLNLLEQGEIDFAVSTIGVTEARAQRVAFSKPYFETRIVALVRNDDSAPRSLGALRNKVIGADQATTSYTAARSQWPNARFVGAVAEGRNWPQMVEEGTVDAFIVDASDQERLQERSGVTLRRVEQPLCAEHFAIAMQKGATDQIVAVNRAIAEYMAEREFQGPGELSQ